MFRRVPPSIFRKFSLYTQQWYMPYRFAVCTVKTPDDGQRNCPKHVEFYSKNKFQKLVHLVGFIIGIYHVARSPERQIRCTALHYTTLHCTDLHYTTRHCNALHCTTLHCVTMQYTTLHYTALHFSALHYTTLHYTTLY